MDGQTLGSVFGVTKDLAYAVKVAVVAEAGGFSPTEAIGLASRLKKRIEKTASGSMITVTDAVNATMISCFVDLSPTLGGSGTPSVSNVRPVGGHDGMTIYVSGDDTDNPDEVQVSWETEIGTVYGGAADAITGEMIVDRKMIVIDGNAEWGAVGSKFYAALNESQYTYRLSQTQVSNMYEFDKQGYGGSVNVTENKKFYLQSDKGFERVWVYDTDYTLETFKEMLNQTPLQITIPINEYTEQFQEHQIKMNRGNNNIWSDSGDITLRYWANSQ